MLPDNLARDAVGCAENTTQRHPGNTRSVRSKARGVIRKRLKVRGLVTGAIVEEIGSRTVGCWRPLAPAAWAWLHQQRCRLRRREAEGGSGPRRRKLDSTRR